MIVIENYLGQSGTSLIIRKEWFDCSGFLHGARLRILYSWFFGAG